MKKVNEIIKERREELGLSLEQVATVVGVNNSTVSRWETGNIDNMKRDKIVKLADCLKISPAVIMGWEIKAPDPKIEELQPIITEYSKYPAGTRKRLLAYMQAILDAEEKNNKEE